MSVEHIKSTPVANLDTVPQVPNTTGEGGKGYTVQVDGYVTVPASASADSTLRFVRVPTTAKIKAVLLSSGDQANAAAVDVGVYYPTTGKTGKPDLVANAIDRDFFASAVVIGSGAVSRTDVTFEANSTGYSRDEINTPLWQALGLTSDPGGFFDIVGSLTVAATTGLAVTQVSVQYVD